MIRKISFDAGSQVAAVPKVSAAPSSTPSQTAKKTVGTSSVPTIKGPSGRGISTAQFKGPAGKGSGTMIDRVSNF